MTENPYATPKAQGADPPKAKSNISTLVTIVFLAVIGSGLAATLLLDAPAPPPAMKPVQAQPTLETEVESVTVEDQQ